MTDYYHKNFKAYFDKTVSIDPSAFLTDFSTRLTPGARVLDVGCGSGRDMRWLSGKGFEVTGFERSPGMADLAKKNAGCPVIMGDFETYDFASLAADGIILSGSLVHVPHGRLLSVIENVAAALIAPGHIFLSLKEGRGKRADKGNRVFYLWQDEDLRPLFKALGLLVVNFSPQASARGTGEVWLGYVLTKKERA
jgi:SAM-dependent methyltransferase